MGWSSQVRAEREAELGQRLSWSRGDLGSICWSVRAGARWPGFCPPAGSHPCPRPRLHGALNKKLMAAGSADCVPHGRSYKPFLGGPGQGTSMPTSLVCRRMIMWDPPYAVVTVRSARTQHTAHLGQWYLAPRDTRCDWQWHQKHSKMGGKWFPFVNSSSTYERTTSHARHCSVTGSADLSSHAVNRWPGPPSSRRGHLSQDLKEARGGWGSCACPLERACLVFKTRGRNSMSKRKAELRSGR